MKIAFLPIDNRPVCYDLAKDITAIDGAISLYIPPIDFLGDLKKTANIEGLINWLESLPEVDSLILSLDTLVYGGLIPSRRSKDSLEDLKSRLNLIKPCLVGKRVYAFSSIMRISNNNYNEEEKEYWAEYGKKLFEYSYNSHKYGGEYNADIPADILEDYLLTRKRNFEINKILLDWQKEGVFETLIFSKDDCAEFGLNVQEANELENLGAKIKTGADEIPLTLLARALEKEVKVFPKFLEEDYKNRISNYEDISIEKSVLGQLELGGFKITKDKEDADIILIVNNFKEKQGELVMGWNTVGEYDNSFEEPSKPYAIADVRYANGADNKFVEDFIKKFHLENFYGYSAWNTSANTLGSLLACLKVKFQAKEYNDIAFKKLQTIRFLDDWAYQANVRNLITYPDDIKSLMVEYETKVFKLFGGNNYDIHYTFPWDRKFEVRLEVF